MTTPPHDRAVLDTSAFDAMISAIAVSQALPIYTFNPKKFAATGAELVDLGEEAEHPTP